MQQNHTVKQHSILSCCGSVLLHSRYTNCAIHIADTPLQVQTLKDGKLCIQFYMKGLQSLRTVGSKKVLQIHMGSISSASVEVHKVGDHFIYHQGRYRNHIKIFTGSSSPLYESEISPSAEVLVQFSLPVGLSYQGIRPTVVFGHEVESVFICRIRNFRIASSFVLEEPTNSQQPLLSVLEEGPLNSIPANQIPSVDTLPTHSCSVEQKSTDTLYLCHDMKGGYQQDTNDNNPFPCNHKTLVVHSYRCLHLAQTSIFNYFSHHLITIPPLHWRRLCKRTHTRCLGTFIIEGPHPSSEELFSRHFAELLIYLCRLYKFDGYLINVEYKVHSAVTVTQWLKFLTSALHQAVPHSQVIWYDCIVENGQVNFQNSLNHRNKQFYEATDGIFLNYWWDQNKIIASAQQAIKGKPVYVGNDCFGRNTFAGGKYNTFKAVNTIRLHDTQGQVLKPALFAMAYSYESGGQGNRELWKTHEKAMYRGVCITKLVIKQQEWAYQNGNVEGFKWDFDDGRAITSFRRCQRLYRRKLAQILPEQVQQHQDNESIIIKFMVTVAGTGPKFQDPYLITASISEQNVTYTEATTGEQFCKSDGREDQIYLTLSIDSGLITQQTVFEVCEMGSDAEKWAGHYGTSFQQEAVLCLSYSHLRDFSAATSIKCPNIPYLTYYNLGHGPDFYLEGRRIKSGYDYLSDMDYNQAYLSNHPYHVDIEYGDAYMGGSCLRITGTLEAKLCQISCQNKSIEIDLIVKYMNSCDKCDELTMNIKIQGNNTGQVFHAKASKITKLKHGWRQYKYAFSFEQTGPALPRALFMQLPNEYTELLVGKLFICASKPQQSVQREIVEVQSVKIRLSEYNPPISPFCYDVAIKMLRGCRILLAMGEHYACFGHADVSNNRQILIKDISVAQNFGKDICKLAVKVLEPQTGEFVTIWEKQVDLAQINKQLCVDLNY